MSDQQSKKKKMLRTRLLELGLLAGSVLFCLILLEFGARWILFRSITHPDFESERALLDVHPVMGWSLVPGASLHLQRLEFSAGVHINEQGLRDRDHSFDKPEGVYRIVLLGDSFMLARQMNVELSMPHLLEEGLENVEVINLGVDGYSPAQSYLALREIGLQYDPDLVLLSFYLLNDLYECSPEFMQLFYPEHRLSYSRPYAQWDESGRLTFTDIQEERARKERLDDWYSALDHASQRRLWERSAIYTYYDLRNQYAEVAPKGRNMPNLNPNIYLGAFIKEFDPAAFEKHSLTREDYRRHWEEAWQTALRMVLEMRELAKENGSDFAFFMVPDKLQVEEHWYKLAVETWPNIEFNLEGPIERILTFAEDNDIPALDLTPAFLKAEAEAPKSLFHEHGDQHWRPAGHAVAAGEVMVFLRRHELVPTD